MIKKKNQPDKNADLSTTLIDSADISDFLLYQLLSGKEYLFVCLLIFL